MGIRLLAILFVLILLSALTNGFSLLFRLAYVIGGVLVFSLSWGWLSLLFVKVRVKRGSDRIQAGQSVTDIIEIKNTARLPEPCLEIEDRSDVPGRDARAVIGLGAGKSRVWRVETKCSRRGRYTVGPVTVAASDPFGLLRVQRTVSDAHSLLVYPATVPLHRFSPQPAYLLGEGNVRRKTHNVTPHAAGIRDYAYGDSFNRIHWPSTARTGRLMVKEFEYDPSSDIWIVLDMQEEVQAGFGDESTEEYAVKIAASIAKRFLERVFAVGLVAWGERLHLLRAEKGAGQLSRILESLAVIRAEGQMPVAEIIADEAKRFSRHSTLVVITPSTDDKWVGELHYLKLRRIAVSAVLLEPFTFGGEVSSLPALAALASSNIPTYLVKQGDSLGKALSDTVREAPLPGRG